MASPIRLAIVTDIHHGPDHFTKKGSAALPLIESFARFVRDSRADVALDLGDRISDESREVDLRLEEGVAAAFRAVDAPRFHIIGNHDRDHLSVEDNERIFERTMRSETVDVGGWRLVLWQADSRIRRPGGFVLTEHDLLWLAQVVRAADRPLVIVSHVPISGHAQTGNYYFERNPDSATYPGAARAREVLRAARVPIVWVAGHVHWNTTTIVDGIPHHTLQSLTETFTTHPEPAAAFGLLELGDMISWRVEGRDEHAHTIRATDTLRRWVPPLPPFHEHPELRARRAAAEITARAAE